MREAEGGRRSDKVETPNHYASEDPTPAQRPPVTFTATGSLPPVDYGGSFLDVYQVDPRDLTPAQVAQMMADRPDRAFDIRMRVAQVRGAEFMMQVAACATTKISVADPILASMLVRRIESGTEGLRVAGTKAFVQRISRALLEVAATNTGQILLTELLESPHVTTIQYVRHDDYQSGATVSVDPGYKLVLLGPGNVPITTTFSTILAHELVHRVHDLRNEQSREHPVGHRDNDNREEENTISGNPNAVVGGSTMRPSPMLPLPTIAWDRPLQLTENAYRAETNQPERFGHRGREGDNGDRRDVLARFEQLEIFAEIGDTDQGHPSSEAEIDAICDAMAGIKEQYEVEPEMIEQVRRDARPAYRAFLARPGTAERLAAQWLVLYTEANAAIARERGMDPTFDSLFEAHGLPCTLTPPTTQTLLTAVDAELTTVTGVLLLVSRPTQVLLERISDLLKRARMFPGYTGS